MKEKDFFKDLGSEPRSKSPISAGLTREAKIRGSEQNREHVFRFERGEILKIYQALRGRIRELQGAGVEPEEEKKFLAQFREEAKKLEKDLDVLNSQYFEQVKDVEVEGPSIGKHKVPVTELDLRKPAEGEPDNRTPYFLLGSFLTNPHQTAALSAALALSGKKVYVMTWPEQESATPPEDWGEKLKKNVNFKLHVELAKKTIEKMGLDEVNLIGASFGGGVALEVASDPEFAHEKIKNLIVNEPMGLEEKSFAKIAYDFVGKEAILKTFLDAEALAKAFSQGDKTKKVRKGMDKLIVNILRRRQFDEETLGKISPKGRFEFWMGSESPLMSVKTAEKIMLDTDEKRQERNPDAKPIEIYEVKGASHSLPFVYACGVAERYEAAPPKEQVAVLKEEDLENSTAKLIVKRLAEKEAK